MSGTVGRPAHSIRYDLTILAAAFSLSLRGLTEFTNRDLKLEGVQGYSDKRHNGLKRLVRQGLLTKRSETLQERQHNRSYERGGYLTYYQLTKAGLLAAHALASQPVHHG